MTNSYNLYRYHELKKRLEKRLDSDWFMSEYVSHTLKKEKEDIYE